MNKELFFDAILDIKKSLTLKDSLFLSVYLYGSVTRLEAIDGISDIDILFMYENKLEKKHTEFLIDLKKKIKNKFGIFLHTRLRILDDIFTGRSGLMDCGFTNSINKLRDGIVLYGQDLSHLYYKYIKQSSKEIIEENLRNRWCDICYRNMDIFQHEETQKKQLLYVISSLSELICYSQGIFTLGTNDSLKKACQLTDFSIFNDYWKIKRGEIYNIDICSTMEKNAEIIDTYACPKKWKNVTYLQNISLLSANPDELFTLFSNKEKTLLLENEIIPKKCEINNEELIIHYFERG